MNFRRWSGLDAFDAWLLSRQRRKPADTDWIAVTIASTMLRPVTEFQIHDSAYRAIKSMQEQGLLPNIGIEDSPESIQAPIEELGYSGAMEIGKWRTPGHLREQTDAYVRDWSAGKWYISVWYTEGEFLQYRIERV